MSVRVAAENRLRPARMTRTRDELNSDVPKSRTAENRQDRLTQNLEAMVGELASLREQLQSVRIAAANIEPRDERVAISRKIPQDVATSGVSPEAEAPLDRTVPDPPDLDLLLDPSAVDSTAVPSTQKENSSESVGRPSTPAVPAIDQPQAPATGTDLLEDSIELPSAGLPQTSAVPVQPLPVQPLPVQSPPVQSLPPDVVASQSLPSQATPAQPARVAVAGDEPDNAWEVPIAARPISTIFPADQRSGVSPQSPRETSFPNGQRSSKAATVPLDEVEDQSVIRLPLPTPAPVASDSSKPALPAPLPFPAAVAEIAEPAVPVPAATAVSSLLSSVSETPTPAVSTPQEPRRLSREIPTSAQRAPLRLADAPVVRPFEVPTRKAESSSPAADSDAGEPKKSEPSLGRFALTSSNSPDKPPVSNRGVTNAKWRAARDDAESDSSRPALRDSRSLFPIFRGSSSSDDGSPTVEDSSASDGQIPQPVQLPRNLIESSSADRVGAPPLITQASAELPDSRRRFAVQASVLHITADDLTTVDRAGVRSLAVMGGHDFRVNQIRHAVRESEAAIEIYSGTVAVDGGVPTRIPIGWLCPHCNDESGVANGDQLVVTLPHLAGNHMAAFYVEQADGTGRSESFRDATAVLIPGASVQITEAAQDGTVETGEADSTPVLSRLPVIGGKFDRKSKERQIMQRIIVLTIREISDTVEQPIQQLSGRQPASGPKVIHADMTAPVSSTGRRNATVPDSSGASTANVGVSNRRPAPPVED